MKDPRKEIVQADLNALQNEEKTRSSVPKRERKEVRILAPVERSSAAHQLAHQKAHEATHEATHEAARPEAHL